MDKRAPLKIKVQIFCGAEIAMGPGKADLLDAIIAHRSISGAGRALGMSYRRTWMLVDVMNRCWAQPLVATIPGGSSGGGAHLTEFGQQILQLYRAIQAQANGAANSAEWASMAKLILAEPRLHQKN